MPSHLVPNIGKGLQPLSTAAANSSENAAEYRTNGWWRDETIVDDLRRATLATPDRTALVCWHADGSDRDVLSYAELSRRVDRLAAGLIGLGVQRGDVVTVQLPNGWPLCVLILACARAGAAVSPVLPTMRRRELEFMLNVTESPIYVGPTTWNRFDYGSMIAEAANAVPTLRRRVLVGDGVPEGDPAVLDFFRDLYGPDWTAEHDLLDEREAKADDIAQIMFTSGTTGEPKGVTHTHNTLYAIDKAQADVLHLASNEITAMGSPTTHQAGYTWNLLMPLLLGATAVQVDRWQPDLMLRILEAERVTFFMGAPTFLADLIATQRETGRDLTALSTFATGSAPIAPVLVEQAAEILGCRVYALWGMTENGGVTITRPGDPPLRASESDGSTVPGMWVRIVDDNGNPVPVGTIGNLQCKGAGQCLGYYHRPDLYAESLSDDGWFDTGDLARDDGHGGVRIAGRIKDLINRGAEKIPVVEVEAVLLRYPGVREVAVVGYPDERLGERACAVVIPTDNPPTLEELCAHLAEDGMAKNYWPERIELVTELPKTPSGKVQKFVLREQLAQRA
jgi:cyclohexanecarboxylate-CoA ligase